MKKFKCNYPHICLSHKGKDYIAHRNDEISLPEESEHVKTLLAKGHILPVEIQASKPKNKKNAR